MNGAPHVRISSDSPPTSARRALCKISVRKFEISRLIVKMDLKERRVQWESFRL